MFERLQPNQSGSIWDSWEVPGFPCPHHPTSIPGVRTTASTNTRKQSWITGARCQIPWMTILISPKKIENYHPKAYHKQRSQRLFTWNGQNFLDCAVALAPTAPRPWNRRPARWPSAAPRVWTSWQVGAGGWGRHIQGAKTIFWAKFLGFTFEMVKQLTGINRRCQDCIILFIVNHCHVFCYRLAALVRF